MLIAQLTGAHDQQLAAIARLSSAPKTPSLSEEEYAALLSCLSAEHFDIRASTFALLPYFSQSLASFNCGDITRAAFEEIANAEHPLPLAAAFNFLGDLPDELLFTTCGTRDGLTALHLGENIIESDILCSTAYVGLCKVLLRLWLLSDDGIETFMRVESSSEARRHQEEINDFVFEVYHKIVSFITGQKTHIDDYASILCLATDLYYELSDQNDIRALAYCILGVNYHSQHNAIATRKRQSQASRLALLLREVVPQLFASPMTLMNHWKQDSAAASPHLRHLISMVLVTLMQQIPMQPMYLQHPYALHTKQSTASFLDGATDDKGSLGTSLASAALDLATFSDEWIHKFLLPLLPPLSLQPFEEAMVLLQELLSLQSTALSLSSCEETAEELLNAIFALSSREDAAHEADYDILVTYALLVARHMHWSLAQSYVRPLFEIISLVSQPLARWRLLTEFWTMVLGLTAASTQVKPIRVENLSLALRFIQMGSIIAADSAFSAASTAVLCRVLAIAGAAYANDTSAMEAYCSCLVVVANTYKRYFLCASLASSVHHSFMATVVTSRKSSGRSTSSRPHLRTARCFRVPPPPCSPRACRVSGNYSQPASSRSCS